MFWISSRAYNLGSPRGDSPNQPAILPKQLNHMYRKSHFRILVLDDMYRKSHFRIHFTNDMYREFSPRIYKGINV
ncbi:MAG: hypothetical protein PWP64_1181 [Candidatus Cloacimonadota bacterium]|nr:hypothetical protein [Candidatus Cloacimonadota bacterium]